MINKLTFIISLCILQTSVFAQKYEVNPCLFNTPLDELNPFFLNENLYFSSNHKGKIDKVYNSSHSKVKKSNFKVFVEDHAIDSNIVEVYQFKGKDNITSFTFYEETKTGYFTVTSGNKKNYISAKNTIFLSEFINNSWTELIPFEYNARFNNLANPCFSTDGNTMYFESDLPGGYGGLDIWYCNRINDKWSTPINAGTEINSSDDEKTPFIDELNILYFSSDRHKFKSGFDIYSYSTTNKTLKHLPSPINSNKDDIGYVKIDSISEGYLSSNRNGVGYDIFKFSRPLPINPVMISSRKAKTCFTFTDPHPFHDSLNLESMWSFGDGSFGSNNSASHCYNKPGEYSVELIILDKKNKGFKENVASKKLTVQENSLYYFDSDTTDKNFSLIHSYTPETNVTDLIWKVDAKLYYDQDIFSFDESFYYGQHVVQAYFISDTTNYLISGTLVFLPEFKEEQSSQKYRLLCSNDQKLLNQQGLETLDIITSRHKSKGIITIDVPDNYAKESTELLQQQLSSFDLTITTRINTKILSPIIEVYYD